MRVVTRPAYRVSSLLTVWSQQKGHRYNGQPLPLGHFQMDDSVLKKKKLGKSLPKQNKKISKPSQLKINFVVSLICEHNTKQICSDLGSILV